MSQSNQSGSSLAPAWVKGKGVRPIWNWGLGTDGQLSALSYARETGDLFLADSSGGLSKIDRQGQIQSLTRTPEAPFALAWSDDGRFGAVITGEENLLRLDANLRVLQAIKLPETALGLAISPFGNHVAVSLANGKTLFYNERKRRIAQFETIRPVTFLKFCVTEPLLFASAEHGLVCCHNLSGAQVWQEKNWSNVGDLEMTGDGDLLYLASFGHGVEVYDGDGAAVGSYVLDGTVNRLAVSYEPQRLAVSTVEQNLYWLDADGELLWSTTVDDPIIDLICDPLGEWLIVGLQNRGVHRLAWE